MSPIKATSKQTHNSKCQPVKNRQTDRQTFGNIESPEGIIYRIIKPPIIQFSIISNCIHSLAF